MLVYRRKDYLPYSDVSRHKAKDCMPFLVKPETEGYVVFIATYFFSEYNAWIDGEDAKLQIGIPKAPSIDIICEMYRFEDQDKSLEFIRDWWDKRAPKKDN